MSKIKVDNSNGLPTIDYHELEDLQMDFKTIGREELNKLKNSIIKHGVFLPKFVWENKGKYWTLDGHQTKKALMELESEYDIPEIPIVKVKAKSKKDAIEKILIINSRYGKINNRTDIFNVMDIDLTEIESLIVIPEIKIVPTHIDIKSGWNPLKYDQCGDGIPDIVGYSLSSFWKDISNVNCEVIQYQNELPVQQKPRDLIRQAYSRTNLEEIQRIVLTYMRKDDYYLESCCGWSTFGSVAKFYGYKGIGIDIWNIAIDHSIKQMEAIPNDIEIKIMDMDAMDLQFDNDSFDFVYCNPPFMDQEKYSRLQNDIADNNKEAFGAKFMQLMSENLRVVKKNGLCVITINDMRKGGYLVPLHSSVIEWGMEAGFKLWDFVVAEVLSQKIRVRKKEYEKRRTVKCHEYVIVFKKI